jgi:hypothetical protein
LNQVSFESSKSSQVKESQDKSSIRISQVKDKEKSSISKVKKAKSKSRKVKQDILVEYKDKDKGNSVVDEAWENYQKRKSKPKLCGEPVGTRLWWWHVEMM